LTIKNNKINSLMSKLCILYIYIYIKKVMINITIKTLILFEKQWHIRLTLFKEDLIIKGKSKNKNVKGHHEKKGKACIGWNNGHVHLN